MRFGWKFLIPITLIWVVSVAFIRGAQLAFFGDNIRMATVIVVGVIATIALAVAWVWDGNRVAAAVPVERPEEIDPFAGGYPVPPLPGQRLREPGQHVLDPGEPNLPGAPSWAISGHTEPADEEAPRG